MANLLKRELYALKVELSKTKSMLHQYKRHLKTADDENRALVNERVRLRAENDGLVDDLTLLYSDLHELRKKLSKTDTKRDEFLILKV